jgi:hypothetical protein
MPKVGDLVCFGFPGENHSPNHVELVVAVHGVRDIDTIGGNTNDAGSRTGGEVRDHAHRKAYIDGYLRPTYTAAAGNGDDMSAQDVKDINTHTDTVANNLASNIRQAAIDIANNTAQQIAKVLDAITKIPADADGKVSHADVVAAVKDALREGTG